MPHAYVTMFVCEEMAPILNDSILSMEDCHTNPAYNKSKYIDCYCKPEDHIAAVASLR